MTSDLTLSLLDAYSRTTPRSSRPASARTRRLRDSQRSKVYAAERFLPRRTTNVFGSRDNAQAYVDSVLAQRWFRSRWGQFAIPVRVGGKGGWSWPDGTISLGTWARNPVSALHEIAHTVNRRQHGMTVPAHGPQFAAIYLFLVRQMLGDDLANRLRESFVTHKVKHRAAGAVPDPATR